MSLLDMFGMRASVILLIYLCLLTVLLGVQLLNDIEIVNIPRIIHACFSTG